jgi:signal transduction histidine kinase
VLRSACTAPPVGGVRPEAVSPDEALTAGRDAPLCLGDDCRMTSGAGMRPADVTGDSVRRRRPRRGDWAVAAVGVLLQLLAPQTGSTAAGERPAWLGALATVFAIGQGIPLAWRRIHAYWVAVIVLACYGGYVLTVGLVPPFAGWVVIWSLATVIIDRRRATFAALAAAGVTCALIVGAQLARAKPEPSALLSLVTVVVALAAVLVRSERDRVKAARAHAIAEERLRIAGDLHDLVGHGLSTVAVQSSTARVALEAGDEQAARAALMAVEASSRTAMREMRQLLGVLRDGSGVVTKSDAPPPGLGDIAMLVDNVRATGVAVTAEVVPEAGQVPTDVQLCVYRVVQEALTNAVKHAPGAIVTVRVTSTEGVLRVVVDSSGGSRAQRAAEGGGLGVEGIRTRVAAAGGQSRIGATAAGWRVDAQLPLGPVGGT